MDSNSIIEQFKVLTGRKLSAEVALEAHLLFTVLSAMKEGDVLLLEQISTVIGRDITERGNQATLRLARKRAQYELGMLFTFSKHSGLRRITNDEIAGKAQGAIIRINTSIDNELQRQELVDESRLSNQLLVTRNVSMSILGALAEFSRPKAIANLIEKAPPSQLSVSQVVAAFGHSKPAVPAPAPQRNPEPRMAAPVRTLAPGKPSGCSEKGCIFPAVIDGLCSSHYRVFNETNIRSQSSMLGAR